MTKKQFLEALEYLDDDAQIHVFCASTELYDGGAYADNIRFENKITGDDEENEITIVASF